MPSPSHAKHAQQESNRWKLWTSIIVPLLVVLLPLLWPDVRVWLHLSKKAPDIATQSVSQSNNSNAQGNGNVANSGGTGNATGTVAGNGNIIGNSNTVKLLPEAKKNTGATPADAPAAKRERAAKKKAEDQPSPLPQMSAPNGIAIGGGTVTNPTVNNITVPRARIRGSSQSQKQVVHNWITEFAISSTDIVPIGIIRLTCDGEILGGGVSSSSAIMGIRHVGLDPSDPTTLVIDLTAPESISPNHPIRVSVSAKTPVQIISGTIDGATIELPITNLEPERKTPQKQASVTRKEDASPSTKVPPTLGITPSATPDETDVDDFSMRVLRCSSKTTRVVCQLSVMNEGEERQLLVSGRNYPPSSRIFDLDGNEYEPASISIDANSAGGGAQILVPVGVPVKAQISFEGTRRDLSSIPLLEVQCSTWGQKSNNRRLHCCPVKD